MTLERLRTTLTALSLTAIDARLETLLENASKKEPAYADFLLEVVSAEADARRQRYLKTRLQLAHLPYVKTVRSVRFRFSTLHRRAADSRAAHAAIRPRSIECHFAGAAWGRQDSSGSGAGGSRYSIRPGCLFHDGARPGHRSRTRLSRRPARPTAANLSCAEGVDHRRDGISAAG